MRIDLATKEVKIVAGKDAFGQTDQMYKTAIGTAARFSRAMSDVEISADGSFALIADGGHPSFRVCKMDLATYEVVPVCGKHDPSDGNAKCDGTGGCAADDGIGTSVRIYPQSVAISSDMSFALVAECVPWGYAERIRRLDLTSMAENSVAVTTVAGRCNGGSQVSLTRLSLST